MKLLKALSILFVVAFLAAEVKSSDDTTPDYGRCDDGDDLMNPPRCPPDDENGLPTYFPYPYNCRKYWQCTNGVAKCILCAEGTVWNQDLLTCVHGSGATCQTVTTPQPTTRPTTTRRTTTTTTPTTTTPTTTTPTTTTPTTTTPTTTTTKDPANWICPEGFTGRMPHPTNCRLFYNCDPARRPCLFECPANLYYNPATRNCDWPANVPSCQGGTPPPPLVSNSNYKTGNRSPMPIQSCDGGDEEINHES